MDKEDRRASNNQQPQDYRRVVLRHINYQLEIILGHQTLSA
jgi:hypothetical protein